jgi:signal transduction histidine kinase
MEVAQAPVESPSRRRSDRFVGAVGRLPLPLGAKLLLGFALVGTLLAVGYSLGLVALSQSNSRGDQLLRLQRQAVGLQIVLTDATQLKRAIDSRINAPGGPEFRKGFGSRLDQAIGRDMGQVCVDSGLKCFFGEPNFGSFHLADVDPKAFELLSTSVPLFYPIINADVGGVSVVQSTLRRTDRFATSFASLVAADARETRARANALVAANRSSFASSRNLLIGVGAGSLALALALGLLLAWSVVVPLRRTDQLERLYAELETASRHKSDFLATMSHELRTPLNAIIGFSEVLHEQMFGELNERQLAYVSDVLEAGRHLLSLINDVLDLAKIEAGRMELELSSVAIPEILRSAVSMLSERASGAGLTLAIDTEPEEITITADERRVRQIVFNLLSNAVKFTPSGGRVDLSALAEDGRVEIAVADTGPGIPPEELERIFEEFEQATAGKKAEGTGLGLPLSRRLVELHGGRLWVDTEPGKGSTFRFTLPTRQEVS